MNEPDSMHMKWEPQNNYPGARDLYLSTMDALHALSPDGWLYFLEGVGQNNFGLNWGNGFISDYNIIQKYGLSDPNYFFQQLLKKPYVNRVSCWGPGSFASLHCMPQTVCGCALGVFSISVSRAM